MSASPTVQQTLHVASFILTQLYNFREAWCYSFSPVDFLPEKVRPEDYLVRHVEIHSHHTLQLGDQADVLTAVHRHLPHLVFSGEEQVGDSPWRR